MSVVITPKLQVDFGAGWVDLSADLADNQINHVFGISGSTPADLVCDGGDLTFKLRNAAVNSGKTLGYYSPGHANVRSGWDYGIPARVVYTYSGTDYPRWTGKIADIDPDPSLRGARHVRVVAHDHMQDLVDADVRAITPQVGQLESTLIGAILDAIPADAQPPARDIDTGIDSVAFAFDKLGSGKTAVAALNDAVLSAFGIAGCASDGTFFYRTRQSRFAMASSATLTDNDIVGLTVPSGREGCYNVVRITYHPKRTASATLWSYTGGTPQIVRAGEEITNIQTPYRDPNQTNQPIGASAVTAPVAGTDYIGKEFADGSGTTLTGDLTVTTSRYASMTAWTIENTGATDAHLTTWQIRGTGIFDDGVQTVESRSTQAYGERVLDLDLPYQDSRYISSGLAQIIRLQRESPTSIVTSVSFRPKKSTTLATLAMTAEVGDVITLSNALTGLSSATAAIQSIAFSVKKNGDIVCTFGLAPTSSFTTPPSAPTGLAVAVASDSQLDISWTNTDVTAETEIYANGVLWALASAGATSLTAGGFTRATDYTITLRHIKYALIRSSATAGVVGRPAMAATGGTVTTPGDGFKYHTFTSSGNLVITIRGRLSWTISGGGGGAAGGGDNSGAEAGGGGGGAGGVQVEIDNEEPTGTHAIVIAGGGSGGTSDGTTGNNGTLGTDSTYRSTVGIGRGGGYGGGVSGGDGITGGGGGTVGGGGGGGGGANAGAGGSGTASLGGSGFGASAGNVAGGGGGGGAAGGGTSSSSGVGGSGGSSGSYWGVTLGAGGKGGRGTGGPSNGAANTSNGGGAGAVGDTGGSGGSGIAIFRYPI